MDFAEFMDSMVSFAQNNTIIAIVIALGILYFMYRKTKLFFSLLILCLILLGLYSLITNMARSGGEQKRKLVPKTEKESVQIPDRSPRVGPLSSRSFPYRFL